MIEGLKKHWGFYIVACRDANGVGVSDLHLAMEELGRYREFEIDLRSSQQQARRNKTNREIAGKILRKVLAARIVVLELFLQLVVEIDGAVQEKHKRIWLLFQLSDRLGSDPGLHPFVRIMINCLGNASNEALLELIGRLGDIRRKYFRFSRFILGLDEAQVAARLYRHTFLSSDNKTYRSIFRETVAIFTELGTTQLVVSGTGLSLKEMEDAMASGVSKPRQIKLFHQLGMFDTWPKLERLLQRYVFPSLLESPSGKRLQQRVREYLLGR
jgi:hypothetical protein